MSETVTISAANEYYEERPTGYLRLRQVGIASTTMAPKLQQEWIVTKYKDGGPEWPVREWRDVPIFVDGEG